MIVAFNAVTMAASEYDIAAVGVAAHDGDLYCLNSALRRFVELGDSAEVVESFIETGEITVAPERPQNVRELWMMLAADSAMRMATLTESRGVDLDVTYEIPALPSASPRARRVKFGRGVRSERWTFRLATTTAGGTWALDGCSMLVGHPARVPK